MVRITRVHTGTGDDGETSLLDGTRVPKNHPRVSLYGTIDEVNSLIGVVRMELERMPGITRFHRPDEANHALGLVQQELFDIGGECSCPPDNIPKQIELVGMEECDRVIGEMDMWLEELEPLESFILPTGSGPVAALHVARTVTRRAERDACALRDVNGETVRDEVIFYLNRLSDWLFVLGRWISMNTGEKEKFWSPLVKRKSKSEGF